MNIAEFKQSEPLVQNWKQIIQSDQTVQHALDAVSTDSPLNGVTTETEPLICLGEIRGYERCLKNLFDLASLTKRPEPLRATYGVKQNAGK